MGCVIGIDLGGTRVRAGALNRAGELLAWEETAIEAARGPERGVRRISNLIADTLGQVGERLEGIGIGATGPVDRERGAIQNPYTLPTWEDVDVASPLSKHFGVPVVLENDADAAALGEYWRGAGQGAARVAMVTVGTGIGFAFVYRGEIYRGLNGLHPEAGHHVVDPHGPPCYCGARGCWESLASGPAMARRAQALVAESGEENNALLARAGGNVDALDAGLVAIAAGEGDALAQRVVTETATYLGLGIVNVIHFLLPQRILLGGGMMRSYRLFRPGLEQVMQTHGVLAPTEQIEVRPAELGQRAGVIGAGYAIFQQLRKGR